MINLRIEIDCDGNTNNLTKREKASQVKKKPVFRTKDLGLTTGKVGVPYIVCSGGVAEKFRFLAKGLTSNKV